MIPLDNQRPGYWATNLYKDPRKRPKTESPLRDLPSRAAHRFKAAREGVRALKHVTEQVVFMGTAWKWESSVSATFILTETEERELAGADGLPPRLRQAMRDGSVSGGVRWCWMEFPDLDAAAAFVHIIRLKHLILSRPE